ncbi:hypothetical protein GGU11DRAFT_304791 [Lentinula aff. detonsa]|nr:hypothetical protein GGU11DRAFT_304791 [Lentinula aff. detonsa]
MNQFSLFGHLYFFCVHCRSEYFCMIADIEYNSHTQDTREFMIVIFFRTNVRNEWLLVMGEKDWTRNPDPRDCLLCIRRVTYNDLLRTSFM